MCIAILKPKGTRILWEEEFNACFDKNKDGFGCMFQEQIGKQKKMKYYKTMDRAKALAFFNDVQTREGLGDCAFHFRWATSGTLDENNCHPFGCGNWQMVMHNWVFSLRDPLGIQSDTSIFAGLIASIGAKWWESAEIVKQLEKYTSGSKLIFMDKDRSFLIQENWASAHWNNGIWYSNYWYVKYTAPEPKPYKAPIYSNEDWRQKSDDYYMKSRKKNREKRLQLPLPVTNKDQEDRIKMYQEWSEYKSSIQGLLTMDQRRFLNNYSMEDTAQYWREFNNWPVPSLDFQKLHIQEFYDFVKWYVTFVETT